MKKNFSVNIGYMLFNIDEDAYERLSSYLDTLRAHLNLGNDPEEVMKDIEIRMAELLSSRLSEYKNVIILDDVEFAIQEMGEPETIEENAPEGDKDKKEEESDKGSRRLFRDSENMMISGVASGMAAFFNIDSLWIRLGFIFLTLVGGSGIFIYLILWLIVPEAKTASERLQMRGEKVTASNLAKNIEKEFHQVKENIKGWGKKGKKSAEKFASDLNDKTGKGGHFFMEVFGRAWQFFLLIFGILLVITTIYLSLLFLFAVFTNIWPHINFSPFSEASFTSFLFEFTLTDLWGYLTLIGLLGLIMIPLLKLMMSGILLVFRLKLKNKIVSKISLSAWILSLTLVMASVTLHSIHYSKTDIDTMEKEVITSQKTIFLDLKADNINNSALFNAEKHGTFLFSKSESAIMLFKYPKISFAKNDVDSALRVVAIAKRRGGSSDFFINEQVFSIDSSLVILSWSPFIQDEKTLWDYSYQIFLPDSCVLQLSANVKDAMRSRNHISKMDMAYDYFVLDGNRLRHADIPILEE
jgi:phage shock protein PspC (stress-responsive transcriptional regulator)